MEATCSLHQRLRIGCVVIMVLCMSVCNVQIPKALAESVELPQAEKIIQIEQAKPAETSESSEIETTLKPESKTQVAGDVENTTDTDDAASSNDAVTELKPESKVQVVDDGKKSTDTPWEPPPPKTEKSSDSKKTMLYVGAGAVAAAAALAIGLGSGGGSSSSEPAVTPTAPSQTPSTSSTPATSSTPSTPDLPNDSTLAPVGADLAGNWSGVLQIINEGRQPVTAVVKQHGNQIQITTSSGLSYGQAFSGSINSNGHILVYDQRTGQDWTTHQGPASSNRLELFDYVNNFKDLDALILKR